MRLVALLWVVCGVLAGPAWASGDPAEQPAAVCEWAALTAAAETGVPADIMGALTLTETGRRRGGLVRPWAWSVNAEGAGSWFDDPAEALAFAEERVEAGRLNLDIGCFQLNYRWHGANFPSLVAMFDPLENARYAARFVRELHAELGDWRLAAGAFHSRTPVHATRYLARFDQLRAGLRARGFQGLTDAPETYNSFALAAPMAPEKVARARERLTLLGAPLGSTRTGTPASLAVVAQGRGPLLGGARGALFGRREAEPPELPPEILPEIPAGMLDEL